MKTTNKDFQEFKKWCNYYLLKYGMNDWTVYFEHEEIKNGVASCSVNGEQRGLILTLAKDPSVTKEELAIRDTARHEVIHALISPVSHLVGDFCTETEWKRQDEALVCRLTNLLDDTKK